MMPDSEQKHHPHADFALHLLELAETAVSAGSLDELENTVLPGIVRATDSCSALMYINDARLIVPRSFRYELNCPAGTDLEKLLSEQFESISRKTGYQAVPLSLSATSERGTGVILYPLQDKQNCIGLIGLVPDNNAAPAQSHIWEKVLHLITGAVNRLLDREKTERQITYLNTYLTVSSMLAQSIGLHELLGIALSCSMDIVSAEAASVLLLDDEKKSFAFYEVEGPAKIALMKSTLPADKGIAASVLQTGQSEIINDVQNDPRFYRDTDRETGFVTRNMIAIPLIAGEEQIGVLEVLNKSGGQSFTEEEQLLLLSIAEEIAFAIRNAKVFEYVVDTYCKQRQGLGSCKGCKRPLGSWTPCAQQRESDI